MGIFALGLIIWMNFGFPVLQRMALVDGVVTAFSVYLVIVLALSYFFGRHFVGLQSVLVFLLVIVGFDVVTPPYLIKVAEPPSVEILQTWGADTFLYLISIGYTNNHYLSYIFTNILFPIATVFLMSYLLTPSKLKSRTKGCLES